MHATALQQQFDQEIRIANVYPEAQKEIHALPGGGLLVRFLRDPGMSFISYTDAREGELDGLIETQTAELRGRGRPFEWVSCAHDGPALPQRLRLHGYASDEPTPILAADLSEAEPALTTPPARPDVTVRPLHGADGLETVIAVMEGVYGGSFFWMRGRMGLHLTVPGYLSMWAACWQGQPACAGWTYFYPGSAFAGLWGGSTRAEHRGKGLYTALLAARAREAAARGRRYLFLNASDMSRPIVERRGFSVLTWEWSWQTGDSIKLIQANEPGSDEP